MHGIDYQEFVGVLADSTHPLYRDYKEKRQAAKVLTFSLIYGSTPAGIAFQLGISVEEAEHLMSLYFKLYPGIETFVGDSHNMAKANAYTVTALGYRKMQYGVLPPFKNTAAFNGCLRNSNNVRVQSAASGVGLFAFGEINRRIKSLGGKVLCTVYDSVEIEVPRLRVAEALEISYYCMDDLPQEKFKWLTFPIGTDAEIGFNWGKLKHVYRGMTQDQIEEILNELSN
jgi:DNA polymerase-1